MFAKNSPKLKKAENSVLLSYGGYGALRSIGDVTRQWAFSDNNLIIEDQGLGSGSCEIIQRLYTPLSVSLTEDTIVLTGKNNTFTLKSQSGSLETMTTKIWQAYGRSTWGSVIQITHQINLPWANTLYLEVA